MCSRCGGAGWLFVEKDGISAAARCPCSISTPKALLSPAPASKPSSVEIGAVVEQFAKTIPFFPREEAAWFWIVEDMMHYIADSVALESFRINVTRYCTKYEAPAGLRQIYCAFVGVPADGVYPLEALPGVNQAERMEASWRAREMDENGHRMAEYRRQALLAPPEDRAPLLLEGFVSELKTISPPRYSPETQPAYSYNKLVESARIARSLQAREKELAEAVRATPTRSEEERAQLVHEIEGATEPLRAALARMAANDGKSGR